MLSKPSVLDLNTHLSSFGSSRVAARFELLVFAELKVENTMGKHRLPEHRGVPPMLSPTDI